MWAWRFLRRLAIGELEDLQIAKRFRKIFRWWGAFCAKSTAVATSLHIDDHKMRHLRRILRKNNTSHTQKKRPPIEIE